MNSADNYIYVELDNNGTILNLECTLLDCRIDVKDFIGKNWFEYFIETSDKKNVLKVFKELFEDKTKEWKTYKNDIKCPTSHRLIDFTNEVINRDGQKIICSKGIEHIHNI
jgi:hypothetical protein